MENLRFPPDEAFGYDPLPQQQPPPSNHHQQQLQHRLQHRFADSYWQLAAYPQAAMTQQMTSSSTSLHDHAGDADNASLPTTSSHTSNAGYPALTEAATTAALQATLQTTELPFSSTMTMDPSSVLATTSAEWNSFPPTSFLQDGSLDTLTYRDQFGGALHPPPVEFPTTSTAAEMLNTTLSMTAADASYRMGLSGPMNPIPFSMGDINDHLANYPLAGAESFNQELMGSSINSGSSSDTLDVHSLSSDAEWTAVDIASNRHSLDSFDLSSQAVDPQALHIRTQSSSSQRSDIPLSAQSVGSFEEIPYPMNSPRSDHSYEMIPSQSRSHNLYDSASSHDAFYQQAYLQSSVSPPNVAAQPVPVKPSSSSASSTSPVSSNLSSPPTRRKKSPVEKSPTAPQTSKVIAKKSQAGKKENTTEKRIGRRRGPLRPDQRTQAHEIRKMRACLRCKFLKKTCDKGSPCAGCQPSHARLWQVPCTRIDIKDLASFMKDWKADFERHVSLGFSVGNITGFSHEERPLFISHGYGYHLPINAREIFVHDTSCFGVDWVETFTQNPTSFEISTHRLSAGMQGIPHSVLSDYLDQYIDGDFEGWVDSYFAGTIFLTDMLKTAFRYWTKTQSRVIRKALKLVVAYNLTVHITLVDRAGLSEDERQIGLITDPESRFYGSIVAPVMINFQIKCALADMWRELQKEILEELSHLFSSVYSGDKLKHWPTIFMLATILLAVWEEMQFDSHYRTPDKEAVRKFCDDMESTPVGVIVGLFSAISQKLPSFSEWDSKKHHHVLDSNPAVCEALTEVRDHVTKNEDYLKSRPDAKFDRQDFDSLSNKFTSKLVLRSN